MRSTMRAPISRWSPPDLAQVVEQHGDVQLRARQRMQHQAGRKRQLVGQQSLLDLMQDADRADGVLVDRVDVIELSSICAMTRPNSGRKRPSTPASFIRLSAFSGSLRAVRIAMNRAFAAGDSRRSGRSAGDCASPRAGPGGECPARAPGPCGTGAAWPAGRARTGPAPRARFGLDHHAVDPAPPEAEAGSGSGAACAGAASRARRRRCGSAPTSFAIR